MAVNNYFGEEKRVDVFDGGEDEYYSPGEDVKRSAFSSESQRRETMERAAERSYMGKEVYPELPRPEARYSVATKTVIGVSCPKGGTGKSSTCKELAYAFSDPAKYSVNGKPLKVLVVDQNYNNPDVHTHFGTTAERNLAKLFRAMERDERATGSIPTYSLAVLESCITRSAARNNLDLMFLSTESDDNMAITPEMVEALFRSIKQNTDYDIIIVDTQDAKQESRLLKIIEACNIFLLVITCELTCIANVRQMLEELEDLKYDLSKLYLCINRVQNVESVTSADVRAYLEDYNILDTVIEHSNELADINNSATSALYEYKKSPYAKSIWNLAEELVEPPVKTEKKGFFEKLFGR